MAIFLIVLGTILAVSGLAAIVGGMPFLAFGFDNTLILAGTVGLTGGLLAIGLGSILAALEEIGSRMDLLARPATTGPGAAGRPAARPMARPPAPPRSAQGPAQVPLHAPPPAPAQPYPPMPAPVQAPIKPPVPPVDLERPQEASRALPHELARQMPVSGLAPEDAGMLDEMAPAPPRVLAERSQQARLQPETLRIPPLRVPEPEPEVDLSLYAPHARPQPAEPPQARDDARPQSRLEAISEAKPGFGLRPRREPAPEARPGPGFEANPQTKPQTKPDAKAEAAPEAKGEPDLRPETKPLGEPRFGFKPVPRPEPKPEAGTPESGKPEGKPDAGRPASRPDVRPDSRFQPKADQSRPELLKPEPAKPELARLEPKPEPKPEPKAEPERVDPFRAAWQKAWGQGLTPDGTPEPESAPTPPAGGAAVPAPPAATRPPVPMQPASREPVPTPPVPRQPEAVTDTPEDPASSRILKAGVIGGMAYTLYADGSIEADLPEGLVRFASVQALRDHVERVEHKRAEQKGRDQAG
ncbi:hypothetical protein [Blastochloris sulfoviridis]|uniref:DUF308 domain-containing protein n=1 Tax=Blastochloris sulfoviridis TaxID=50712 RepID=A0A5M6I3T5_9HYPH|nr:hypothetical protein [Blastochloris sulfoviridis]KAA5602874.1 hypothetical protein F1193_03285 [Blastochloris sulfoviridis]